MRARGAVGAVAAVLLVLGLTACIPEPEPTPTPTATGFASEAEAFAAAEETYRAYVEALNQVDLSDPDTFEAVYAWTTGEANAAARESFSQMHANGWTVGGESRFDGFTPEAEGSGGEQTITAQMCLDVTRVEVTDATGASMVSPERLDRQPARVGFQESDTPTGLAISSSTAIQSDVCAG